MSLYLTDANTGEPTLFDEISIESISPSNFLGDEVITGNGANQYATIPAGTKTIWIRPRGGLCYWKVNGAAAAATAGGYTAQDKLDFASFANITSFGIFAAVGVTVHLIYE